MRRREVLAELATLDQKINALESVIAANLHASDRAVTKAETANDRRFDSVNAFRSQLADQAARFATRENVDVTAAGMRERIETLTNANRKLIDDLADHLRIELAEVRAQSTRLLFALLSTVIGTLIAALVVAWHDSGKV